MIWKPKPVQVQRLTHIISIPLLLLGLLLLSIPALAQQLNTTCPSGLRFKVSKSESGKEGYFQCVIDNPVVIPGLPTLGCAEWGGKHWKQPTSFVSCQDPKSRSVTVKLPPDPMLDIERIWPSSRGYRTTDEKANLMEFVETIRGIQLGQPQATVKAMLQKRGVGWRCVSGEWHHNGKWIVACEATKKWVYPQPQGFGNYLKIHMVFSVIQRVRLVDPDTQMSHVYEQPDDHLVAFEIPGCEYETGTDRDRCESPLGMPLFH